MKSGHPQPYTVPTLVLMNTGFHENMIEPDADSCDHEFMRNEEHERRPTVEIDHDAKRQLKLIAVEDGCAIHELATEAAWMLIRKRRAAEARRAKATH